MKKILTLLTLTVTLSSLFAQKQNLSFNLQKGNTYYQTLTSLSVINQTLGSQIMEIKVNMTCRVSYKVNEINNNQYNLDVKYESLSMKMFLPNNMTMEFSSENKEETSDQMSAIFSKVMKALTQTPFQMELTKKGKIISIKNIDAIFEKMFSSFPSMSPEQKAQIKSQIGQSFGPDQFKSNFEMMMAIYPEQPVAIGEKWKTESISNALMSLKASSEFQLINQEGELNTIKGKSQIVVVDKNAFVNTNGIEMRFDMTGEQVTELKVNKRTGWVEAGKLTQSLKGKAITKDSPQTPGGMAIPMDIVTTMNLAGK